MNINYRLFDPTGNITILVETPVLIKDQPYIATELCKSEPTAEQVGFVWDGDYESDISLRMAGGEFCGNATMSAAVFFCDKTGLNEDDEKTVRVKAYGTPHPVEVTVKKKNGTYLGFVNMPSPRKIYIQNLFFEGKTYRYPIVDFGGISHIIIEDNLPVLIAERAIKKWCIDLHADGLGLMQINSSHSELVPLVYVPGADTMYWESSCASGTSAVGAYLANRENADIHLKLSQPGGILSIDASKDGKLILGGKVSIL